MRLMIVYFERDGCRQLIIAQPDGVQIFVYIRNKSKKFSTTKW